MSFTEKERYFESEDEKLLKRLPFLRKANDIEKEKQGGAVSR